MTLNFDYCKIALHFIHFIIQGLVENADVANFYESLTRSLNPANLAGYIRSYVDRTPLPLVRPILGPPMPDAQTNPNEEPTVILTEVCLVTGDRAVELSRALADMNGRMDPKRTQFLMVIEFIYFNSIYIICFHQSYWTKYIIINLIYWELGGFFLILFS